MVLWLLLIELEMEVMLYHDMTYLQTSFRNSLCSTALLETRSNSDGVNYIQMKLL